MDVRAHRQRGPQAPGLLFDLCEDGTVVDGHRALGRQRADDDAVAVREAAWTAAPHAEQADQLARDQGRAEQRAHPRVDELVPRRGRRPGGAAEVVDDQRGAAPRRFRPQPGQRLRGDVEQAGVEPDRVDDGEARSRGVDQREPAEIGVQGLHRALHQRPPAAHGIELLGLDPLQGREQRGLFRVAQRRPVGGLGDDVVGELHRRDQRHRRPGPSRWPGPLRPHLRSPGHSAHPCGQYGAAGGRRGRRRRGGGAARPRR